jgi:hypothetical protein
MTSLRSKQMLECDATCEFQSFAVGTMTYRMRMAVGWHIRDCNDSVTCYEAIRVSFDLPQHNLNWYRLFVFNRLHRCSHWWILSLPTSWPFRVDPEYSLLNKWMLDIANQSLDNLCVLSLFMCDQRIERWIVSSMRNKVSSPATTTTWRKDSWYICVRCLRTHISPQTLHQQQTRLYLHYLLRARFAWFHLRMTLHNELPINRIRRPLSNTRFLNFLRIKSHVQSLLYNVDELHWYVGWFWSLCWMFLLLLRRYRHHWLAHCEIVNSD